MTDKDRALVKQLLLAKRSYAVGGHTKHEWVNPDGPAAADLIEELDRHLTLSGKVSKALSERIETLETQLESANEALRERLDICETQAREIERLRGVLRYYTDRIMANAPHWERSND